MEKVGNFFKTRSVEYWLMAGAFVCGLVALISYAAAGTYDSVPDLSGAVIAALIVFVVLAAAMLVYELRIVKYLTAAVAIYAVLMFLVVQIPYITLIITTQFMHYSDPFTWEPGFFLTTIFGLIAFGLSIASAVMTGSGLSREKKTKKIEKSVDSGEEVEA